MQLGSIPAPGAFAPESAEDVVQVVARTPAYAEVRIALDGGNPTTIGTVRLAHDSWCWEHSDGEQSSPVATTRLAAARALAAYHRAHKPSRVHASMRDRLDAARVR